MMVKNLTFVVSHYRNVKSYDVRKLTRHTLKLRAQKYKFSELILVTYQFNNNV